MSGETIRIAGASGFWGDAARSTPQLLKDEDVDFIVYDYLAEITMSIMARARAKNPDNGYALDFVSAVMKPNLKEIARQSVRIISNAGQRTKPKIIKSAGKIHGRAPSRDLRASMFGMSPDLLQCDCGHSNCCLK
mgnify:CR=1 FL=1